MKTIGGNLAEGVPRELSRPASIRMFKNGPSPEFTPAAVGRLAKLIAKALDPAEKDGLRKLYSSIITSGGPAARLSVDVEMTKRGVPPSCRPAPRGAVKAMNSAEAFPHFLADAQWLAIRYPRHRAKTPRARQIFRPSKFLDAASAVFWISHNHHWRIVRDLALTRGQQLECEWLCTGTALKSRKAMQVEAADVRSGLFEAQLERGSLISPTYDPTVERRILVWKLAGLLKESPTRVAEAYAGLTGLPMSRQLAHKIIGEARDDIRATKHDKSE